MALEIVYFSFHCKLLNSQADSTQTNTISRWFVKDRHDRRACETTCDLHKCQLFLGINLFTPFYHSKCIVPHLQAIVHGHFHCSPFPSHIYSGHLCDFGRKPTRFCFKLKFFSAKTTPFFVAQTTVKCHSVPLCVRIRQTTIHPSTSNGSHELGGTLYTTAQVDEDAGHLVCVA